MLPVKRRQHNAKLNGQNFYAPEFYSPSSNLYDNNYYDIDDIDIVSQDQVSSVTFADAAALEMGDTVVEEKDDRMEDMRGDDDRNGGFEHHMPVTEITAISTSPRDRSRPLSPPSGSGNKNHRGRGGDRQRRSSMPSKFPSTGKQNAQPPEKEEPSQSFGTHEPLSEKLLVLYNEEQQLALKNSQPDVNCSSPLTEERYNQVIMIYKEQIGRLVKINQRMERRLKQTPIEMESARTQVLEAVQRLAEQQAHIDDLSQENLTLRRTVKDLLEHQGDNSRGSAERGSVVQNAKELLNKDTVKDVSLAPTAASTASKFHAVPGLRRCASFDSSTKFKASDTDSENKKFSSYANALVLWPQPAAGEGNDSVMESTTEPPSIDDRGTTRKESQTNSNRATHDRIMEGLREKKKKGNKEDDGGDTEEETSEEDKEQEAILLAHLNARDEISRYQRGMGIPGSNSRLGTDRATLRRPRRRASASGVLDGSKSGDSNNSRPKAAINSSTNRSTNRVKSQRPRRGSVVLGDGLKPSDAGKRERTAPERARKSSKGTANTAAVNTKMKMTASQITSSRGRATSRRSLLLRRRQTPPPQRTGMNSAGIPVAITMQ